MAHDIVDRGADTFRKTFVVKRRRNGVHFYRRIIDDAIDFLCAHALADLRGHLIENGNIDLRTLADTFDLLRRLDHAVLRHLNAKRLKVLQFIVKFLMAVLVFFTASAPAGVVAPRSAVCQMQHFYHSFI